MSRGLISDAVLTQIKERLDIVDVVSGHVTLTRAGQNFKARCPFHDERTPSFTVSPSKQLFHCFGCGASGDTVTFYMKVSGLVFPEAVRELGRRVGIDVPDGRGPEGDRETQVRRRLEQLNDEAQSFFMEMLRDPGAGRSGREYLERRGIEPRTAEQFRLGYATPDWDRLVRALTARGFTGEELVQAGLAVPRQQGGRQGATGWYTQFRDRVMFPIADLRRRVVGFGGRMVGDGHPKYLNSQETPLFHKGRTLYALDAAHEAAGRAGQLIVVEGYFDVIALHQAGIQHVVATLGTALTPEHVRVIRRYVNHVVLLFDPDAAGVRAALRSLDLFVGSGLTVTVMSLPQGEDPDTFVRAQGADAFRELLGGAPSLWDFALEQSLRTAATGRLEDKVRCADAVVQIIQKIHHPIERDERLRRVAERLGLSETRLKEHMRASKSAPGGPPTSTPAVRPTPKVEPPVERELVHLLLHGLLTAGEVAQLDPDLFTVPAFRLIATTALDQRGHDGRVLVRPVLDALLPHAEAGPVATALSVLERQDDDVRATVRGCMARLVRQRRERLLAELALQLKEANQAGRVEDEQRLNARVNALRMEKAGGRA